LKIQMKLSNIHLIYFTLAVPLRALRVTSRSSGKQGSPRREHVVSFQQNEIALLPDWVGWNAHLFGLSNVHVIDHKSTDKRLRKYLSCCQREGLDVEWVAGEFKNKHNLVSNTVNRLIRNTSFIFILDSDEFLLSEGSSPGMNGTWLPNFISHSPFQLNADRTEIWNVLNNLNCEQNSKPLKPLFRRGGCPASRLARTATNPSIFFPPVKSQWGSKVFYCGGNKQVTLDQGDHGDFPGLCSNNVSLCYDTVENLSLVHFAMSDYASWLKKMQRGADSYGYTIEICENKCSNMHSKSGECQGFSGRHYCTAILAEKKHEGLDLYKRLCDTDQLPRDAHLLTYDHPHSLSRWLLKNSGHMACAACRKSAGL